MKKLNVKNNFTKSNQNGITLIALIVTIIVLIIIAGISIATLTADNGVLRQTNLARVTQIESTAREQVKLACSAMRLAIAEARAQDNSYSAVANAQDIQAKLLETIKADNTNLKKDGWNKYTEAVNTVADFKISYSGEDYKKACNDDAAEIIYTITLGQSAIEITDEVNATLKDQNGNNADIDIGGGTGSGSGSGSGTGGSGSGVYDEEIGLYFDAPYKSTSKVVEMDMYVVFKQNGAAEIYITGMLNGQYLNGCPSQFIPENSLVYGDHTVTMGADMITVSADNRFVVPEGIVGESAVEFAYSPETEYHDLYFNTMYYSQQEGYYDVIAAEDGSYELGNGYKAPAGALQQVSSHLWTMDGITGGVSMDGKNIYLDDFTLIYSTTPLSETEVTGGLYDSEGNLLASCEKLTETYGLDIEKDYSSENYQTDTTSLYYILNNYEELSSATKLIIGSNVEKIGSYALSSCSGLIEVELPDGISTIGEGAFLMCTNLSSLYLPDSITSIGGGSFTMCTSIEYVTIPNTLETIEPLLFWGCSSLTGVDIPDSVLSIGLGAFNSCENLKNIHIPVGVETIGEECFAGDWNLESITVAEGNNSFKSMSGNLYSKDGYKLIQYAVGNTAQVFDIPEGVKNIGPYSFYQSKYLISVTIPNSVTNIEKKAFGDCYKLEDVMFEENSNLTSIGRYAFSTQSTLGDIVLPYGITTLEAGTFSCPFGVNSVTIPNSVTKIDEDALVGADTVYFNGTIEECSKITFADVSYEYTLVCTDGTYTRDGI